jgi:RNA polymerase sigma-70 factor (ECF subfamily)
VASYLWGGTLTTDGETALRDDWFTALITEIGPEAVALATYWTGRSDAAEDLVQEAVVRAWQHRDRLQTATDPRAWFYLVLRRLVTDHFRRAGRRPAVWPLDALLGREPTVNPYPALDTGLVIQEALNRLRPGDQEVLAWRYGLDLTVEQIAERMGLSIAAVKPRLRRALERLRKEMAQDGR